MAGTGATGVKSALARLRVEPFADLRLAEQLNQICRQLSHSWRDTLLTPLVTLRLFMLQILHHNTAIAHLRQLSGIDFAPASYCEARQRLPLAVLSGLLEQMVQWVNSMHPAPSPAQPPVPRVLVVDGSSFSTCDTAELRKRFGLPPSTTQGVGYPVAKILGLLDLATGLFVKMLALPLFMHDMRQVAQLHPMLRCGDILLGDRAFCSYAHVALLNAAGVGCCFRLHQKRKTNQTNQTNQTGKRRGIERWHRPDKPPVWMSRQQWDQLPQYLDVRIARYTIRIKGRRTRHVVLATTLLNEKRWPDAKLAELYGQRWQIETCFDHLKTTMGMNVLKCQSTDGVLKELAMYLLIYNLVRLAMLRYALQQEVPVERISFIDALRWVCSRILGLSGVSLLLINPDRSGRREPRVIRRRLKEYNLMKRPRAELKRMGNWGENR